MANVNLIVAHSDLAFDDDDDDDDDDEMFTLFDYIKQYGFMIIIFDINLMTMTLMSPRILVNTFYAWSKKIVFRPRHTVVQPGVAKVAKTRAPHHVPLGCAKQKPQNLFETLQEGCFGRPLYKLRCFLAMKKHRRHQKELYKSKQFEKNVE